MNLKKKTSALFFGLILFILPLVSSVSNSTSEGFALASIWSDGDPVFASAAVIVETGAGVALALGAICPPQFAVWAIVGA
jgi:hypothetical protein